MPQHVITAAKKAILAMIVASAATTTFAQGIPQAPDDGRRWDSAAQSNQGLDAPRGEAKQYDAFAPTKIDQATIASMNPADVTIASLSADAAWQAATITRAHTFQGGVAALEALGNALYSFQESPRARGEALMRIVEINLRLGGATNNASLISAGARILTREERAPAVAYMRGMAQDLRKVGAIAAAQYLENAATLAEEGLGDTNAGVLDAATLALRFGAKPQPDLAQVLSYDTAEIKPALMRDLVIDTITRIGQTIQDPAYAELAQKLERNANQDGIAHIRAQISEAKSQQDDAKRARRENIQAAPKNTFSTIIDKN